MRRVSGVSSLQPGKYILYKDYHFVGFEIWQDGACILRPTCRTHVGTVRAFHPGLLEGYTDIFQMVGVGSEDHGEKDVLGGSVPELFDAIWAEDESLVQILLDQGLSPDVCRDSGGDEERLTIPATAYAYQFGRSERIACMLVARGGTVHWTGSSKATTLHHACLSGWVDAAEAVLGRGACLNAVDFRGLTCLHYAAWFGQLDCVKFLLSRRGDPLKTDIRGDTPLSLSREFTYVSAALMNECWGRIEMVHIVVRNLEDLHCFLDQTDFFQLCSTSSALQKQKRFFVDDDVFGGSGSGPSAGSDSGVSRTGIIQPYAPDMWLRLCWNRAQALEKKIAKARPSHFPNVDMLVQERGWTVEQAVHYHTCLAQSLQRQIFMRRWHRAMPAQIRQSFRSPDGLLLGIRIPLPPLGNAEASLSLPAGCPDAEQILPKPQWLSHVNANERDKHIRFQDTGHVYFIDGAPVDISVTGVIGQYAKACHQLCQVCVMHVKLVTIRKCFQSEMPLPCAGIRSRHYD